jgi:hypothetical protein
MTRSQFELLKIVHNENGNFNPAYSKDLKLPNENMSDTISDLSILTEKGYIEPLFHSRYDVQAYFKVTYTAETLLKEILQ